MGSTLRFPPALKLEADAYAAALGISFNALCAVAVREYLSARSSSLVGGVDGNHPSETPAEGVAAQAATASAGSTPLVKGRVSAAGASLQAQWHSMGSKASDPYKPCPCGSGDKAKFCRYL